MVHWVELGDSLLVQLEQYSSESSTVLDIQDGTPGGLKAPAGGQLEKLYMASPCDLDFSHYGALVQRERTPRVNIPKSHKEKQQTIKGYA